MWFYRKYLGQEIHLAGTQYPVDLDFGNMETSEWIVDDTSIHVLSC